MPTAAVNGTTLHFETAGDTGPPVLLVMGLRARGIAWRPVVERLSVDHRVVWYDHRGVGESAPLAGPTSMTEMAADAAGLLDHLGWDTAHVAGVSMGGMVAQHVLLDHGQRVRSASLIATTAHGKGLQKTDLKSLMRYVRTFFGDTDARLAKLSTLLYSAGHIEREGIDAVVAHMKTAFGHDHPGTARAQVRAVRQHDTRPHLRDIRHPTLVVAGGDDIIIPEWHARQLADGLGDAEYARFPGAQHGVIAEEADGVVERIRGLVRRVEGG